MPFESEDFRKEFDKHVLSRTYGKEESVEIPQGLTYEQVRNFLFNLQRQARVKLGLDKED